MHASSQRRFHAIFSGRFVLFVVIKKPLPSNFAVPFMTGHGVSMTFYDSDFRPLQLIFFAIF